MSVISKENKKIIVAYLDEIVKLNGVLESFDSIAFGFAIDALDSQVLQKLPIEYQALADTLVAQIGSEDYDGAAETFGEIAKVAMVWILKDKLVPLIPKDEDDGN